MRHFRANGAVIEVGATLDVLALIIMVIHNGRVYIFLNEEGRYPERSVGDLFLCILTWECTKGETSVLFEKSQRVIYEY